MSVLTLNRPLLAARRKELEDAVERALAALDALDGDPDFEDQAEDEGAQCDDEGAVETDDDRSDYEASFCGVRFGTGAWNGLDAEATSAAFVMDHREGEWTL